MTGHGSTRWGHVMVALVAAVAARSAPAQPASVVNSKHNLSASGPGTVRAAAEDEVCIFCHTPHNASPIRPLWNRQMPVDAYSIYTSRALDATVGQPTGTSKMCLSCHDGTIALGTVVSRTLPILMSGGVTTMPSGAGNLGTSLRDDHPISFRFDSSLATRDPKLRPPATLPTQIHLDANSELQCTSCHDAHNDSLGKFLVMQNTNSELCVSCHAVGTTTVVGHSNCNACHQSHTAPSGPYLLKRTTITSTCLSCHDGSVPTAPAVSGDMAKASNHDTGSPVDPLSSPTANTTCADCHDPHTMGRGAGVAPAVHPNFGRIAGVNASGSAIAAASFEYEACFKCHADGASILPSVSRRIVQNNTRLEFAAGAVSFHPVEGPGRNTNVPSLRTGYTTSTVIYCSSCHNTDTGRTAGGSGKDGVHGSTWSPVLVARYETADYTSESASAYALCYKCHDRTSILNDRSFKRHHLHIVDQRTPCSACHDAHGISSTQGTTTGNSNLINFSTTIVQPSSSGRLEFQDTGTFTGTCYLRCHGENHNPYRY